MFCKWIRLLKLMSKGHSSQNKEPSQLNLWFLQLRAPPPKTAPPHAHPAGRLLDIVCLIFIFRGVVKPLNSLTEGPLKCIHFCLVENKGSW